jgi:hypothetical protein
MQGRLRPCRTLTRLVQLISPLAPGSSTPIRATSVRRRPGRGLSLSGPRARRLPSASLRLPGYAVAPVRSSLGRCASCAIVGWQRPPPSSVRCGVFCCAAVLLDVLETYAASADVTKTFASSADIWFPRSTAPMAAPAVASRVRVDCCHATRLSAWAVEMSTSEVIPTRTMWYASSSPASTRV